MTDKLLIFVPTYNERDNAPAMARQLAGLGLDADLLFVDDGSPDGTGELLDALVPEVPRLHVIHRAGKLGIGTAHQAGIAWAYDRGYATLVTLDCDFTHSPSDVPRLIAAAADADLAVGSRHLRAGSLPGWSLWRRGLTRLGHRLTRSVLGLAHDATGAFRCYRLDRIPRQIFALVPAGGTPSSTRACSSSRSTGCGSPRSRSCCPAACRATRRCRSSRPPAAACECSPCGGPTAATPSGSACRPRPPASVRYGAEPGSTLRKLAPAQFLGAVSGGM